MSDLNAEIKAAIDSFDMDKARELLRDALKDADAETYYLASKAAIDDEQKQEFLEKAVEADQFHEKARESLKAMQQPDQVLPQASPVKPTQPETLDASAPMPSAETQTPPVSTKSDVESPRDWRAMLVEPAVFIPIMIIAGAVGLYVVGGNLEAANQDAYDACIQVSSPRSCDEAYPVGEGTDAQNLAFLLGLSAPIAFVILAAITNTMKGRSK